MTSTRPSNTFAVALGLVVMIGLRAESQPAAKPRESLGYTFIPSPDDHRLRVAIRWRTAGRTESYLSIDERWGWIDDPSSFISDLCFEPTTGVERRDNTWRIEHERGAVIRCTYTVTTGHHSFDWNRTYLPITARKFFHGVGHTFLITPDPARGHGGVFDVEIDWQLPDDWNGAVSSLGEGTRVGETLNAIELRRSVFLAGSLNIKRGDLGGRSVTVAMHDLFDFDIDDLFRAAGEIIAAECAFMREDDFPPYLITAIPVGDPLDRDTVRRGGTGLHGSVTLFLPPVAQLDENVMFLIAHEVFHYWNGGILHRKEPQEHTFWFSEGFTDYYACRILLEAFPPMRRALAARVNRTIRAYIDNEAIGASNEEIRAKFFSNRRTYGDMPYQRGLLLALRWDQLAKAHGIPEGIDRLTRTLIESARRDGSLLSNKAIRAAGLDVFGEWFGEEFDLYATGQRPVTISPDALEPWLSGALETSWEFDVGFDFDRSKERGVVLDLRPDSAAFVAGLREGDALLGWRLVINDPDQPATLTVRRDGEVREIAYRPRRNGRTLPVFHIKE